MGLPPHFSAVLYLSTTTVQYLRRMPGISKLHRAVYSLSADARFYFDENSLLHFRRESAKAENPDLRASLADDKVAEVAGFHE
jgi:hypothetical protein